MRRSIDANDQGTLWLERLVWNAAAGAAVAVMILILLGSQRCMDRITPQAARELAPSSPAQLVRSLTHVRDRSTKVAGENRPSG